MKSPLLYIVSLLAVVSSVQAEGEISLDPVIVEARALDEATAKPTPSVTVLTEEQLAQSPAVSQALANVPGVHVVETGGTGQPTAVFIRGAPSEQTLVLLDGIEINDPSHTSRGFDFANLGTDGIERIEVFRGPETLRFGPAAAGGVINIVTKRGGAEAQLADGRPKPVTFTYRLEGGSYSTGEARLGVLGSKGSFHHATSAAALTSEGFSAAGPLTGSAADKDGQRRYNFLTRLTYDVSPTATADFTLRSFANQAELDFSGGESGDDPNYKSHVREWTTGAGYQGRAMGGRLRSSVSLAYTHLRRDYDNDPDSKHSDDYHESFIGETQAAGTRHTYTFNSSHAAEFFVQNKAEAAQSSRLTRHRQIILGEGLIYKVRSGPLTLMGGLRHDSVHTQSALTHSVSGTYTWGSTSLRAAHASGFRAPSLYQLHSSFGSQELKPERTQAAEFSLEHSGTKATVAATWFHNRFQDLIDFDMAASRYGNIARATAQGVELQAETLLPHDLSLASSYTYLETRDEATGARLPRRPDHAYSLALTWAPNNWKLSLQHTHTGPRPDIDPDTFQRTNLPTHALTNFSLQYRLSPALSVHLRAFNLFDQKYKVAAGYNTPGISAYAGISGEL